MEVDTPAAYLYPVTDPHINVFDIKTQSGRRFLQSSPEYSMKLMLSEYQVSIYQICKVFRNDQCAKYHHHEFMMLEWYRVGFNEWNLMSEIEDLISLLDKSSRFIYRSYQSLFERYIGINPHKTSVGELEILVQKHIGISNIKKLVFNDYLDLLFIHLIEPKLKKNSNFVFVYHYPKSQSFLARVTTDQNDQNVAARFELFYKGIELANGYYELNDIINLQAQFEKDLKLRKILNLELPDIDRRLLSCIENLPNCAGVSIGLDRLFMCLLRKSEISEVSFCV